MDEAYNYLFGISYRKFVGLFLLASMLFLCIAMTVNGMTPAR